MLCSPAPSPQLADACASSVKSTVLSNPNWTTHKRCELEPDLDSTSLSLPSSCSGVALPTALARCWLTRLLANYDGGLEDAGVGSWSFKRGTKRNWYSAFERIHLDTSISHYGALTRPCSQDAGPEDPETMDELKQDHVLAFPHEHGPTLRQELAYIFQAEVLIDVGPESGHGVLAALMSNIRCICVCRNAARKNFASGLQQGVRPCVTHF